MPLFLVLNDFAFDNSLQLCYCPSPLLLLIIAAVLCTVTSFHPCDLMAMTTMAADGDIIKTDLLIVGAGPAGASLACFLASHGKCRP